MYSNITADEFLTEINNSKWENLPASRLDYVYDVFNDLCYGSKWEVCAEILTKADIPNLDIDMLLGFLTCTLCIKNRLGESREDFYKRVETEFHIIYADSKEEKVEGLLSGLK